MDKPFVSVFIPVYNSEKFLSQAIESVLSQTYNNFELIIIDDGSTDKSYQISKKYLKLDSRIRLFKNDKNMGVGFTFNRAIGESKGNFIARMDSDDVMVCNRLEKQIDFMKKNRDIVCLGSWMKEINEKNEIIGERITPLFHRQIYEKMFYEMAIQNPSLMINKNLVPENFEWCKTDGILDDLDLLFKLLQFGKFANINDYLMLYRIHDNNLSLKNIEKTFNEALLIRKKAVTSCGYTPTIKAKIISLVEQLAIKYLPKQSHYALYKIFTKTKI